MWCSTFKKPRSELRKFSKKRLKEQDARAECRRVVFERCGGRCEVDGCARAAREVHEPETRARGGDYLDPNQCKANCIPHHRWAHDHPKAAARLGLLVSYKYDPATPVKCLPAACECGSDIQRLCGRLFFCPSCGEGWILAPTPGEGS